jgi:hypothetical protein
MAERTRRMSESFLSESLEKMSNVCCGSCLYCRVNSKPFIRRTSGEKVHWFLPTKFSSTNCPKFQGSANQVLTHCNSSSCCERICLGTSSWFLQHILFILFSRNGSQNSGGISCTWVIKDLISKNWRISYRLSITWQWPTLHWPTACATTITNELVSTSKFSAANDVLHSLKIQIVLRTEQSRTPYDIRESIKIAVFLICTMTFEQSWSAPTFTQRQGNNPKHIYNCFLVLGTRAIRSPSYDCSIRITSLSFVVKVLRGWNTKETLPFSSLKPNLWRRSSIFIRIRRCSFCESLVKVRISSM